MARLVASGVLLLLVAACAPAAAPSPAVSGPEDVEWRLVRLGERAVEPASPSRAPTLRLDAAARRAGGRGGCNQFGGGYELEGASLRFAALASTRMACEHGMEIESDYFAALARVRGWRLAAGRLELLDGSGRVLATFERASPP